MSTIVAVRKGTQACIACDTLATFGSLKQKARYAESPGKLFPFRDMWIGTVGYSVHNTVLASYFDRHPDDVKLDTPAEIFETWRRMHAVLEEEYHLNPRKDSDDAYKTTRMTALIAGPRGIFHVTPARDVESLPRFWAIGSGADYALGAMFALFDGTDDVERIARAGVAAGAEFDDGSDLPVISQIVGLQT
ncbi:MAG: MFS transporter [Burkholderiales bacterium]|nr:MFS transporter [Burkholderiales bacterium]